MAKGTTQPVSTQTHLPFAAIEKDVIILRDGSYRAVISVGSTNFMLKSQAEQESLIVSYQGFLNALNFNIQIVMQSRNLDLEPYLKQLQATIITQRNELIKQQTEDYIKYVRELITMANIMDKKFYVVVPYTPTSALKKGLINSFVPSRQNPTLTIDPGQFNLHREELMQRTGIVASGLAGLGLSTVILETEELVRLFYAVYNSDIASEERIDQPDVLTEQVVSQQPPEEAEQTTEQILDQAAETQEAPPPEEAG